MKNMLSVVLPAYNEELMIGKTCKVLRKVLEGAGIPYELVLVNDGSSDNTWEEILKAGHKDPAGLGVRFPEISGKKRQFLQEWRRHPEMWSLLWTATSSIRLRR